MATDTLTGSIPQLELTPGMQVVFEAVSPTTGLAITGVKVLAVAIFNLPTGAGAATGVGVEPFGPFMFVPGPAA